MPTWSQSERWFEEYMKLLAAGQEKQDQKFDAMWGRVDERLKVLENSVTTLKNKMAFIGAIAGILTGIASSILLHFVLKGH